MSMVDRLTGVILMLVVVTVLPARAGASASCPGDCNGDGAVGIEELIAALDRGLGRSSPAGCDEFDLGGDGTVEIHEILQLVRTALAGCPGDLAGVYDVDDAGVAQVLEREGTLVIEIEYSILTSLSLETRPGSDDTFTMEGWGIESGDLRFTAEGSGRVVRSETGVEISGTVSIHGFRDRTETFTLRRPRDGTPAIYEGTHRFRLSHVNGSESRIDLGIAVPPSGRAMCAAAEDVRDDTVIAELPATECWVSPQGRFRYSAPYDDDRPHFIVPLQIEGVLPGSSFGTGTFWIASFPRVLGRGTWSAEKVE
jgi:hypothetical protein